MMVLLVYLASIANNIRVFTGLMTFASIILSIVFAIQINENSQRVNSKHLITSLAVAVLMGLMCTLTPTTEEVYKIAGVAGQEKAIISVTGQPTSVNHVEVVKP